VAVGLVVAAAAALAAMPPPGRTVALLLAPTLARWAMVVQCHGGRGTPARAPATAIVGRASFREFGIASVTALGAALVLADARGLAAAMGAAGIMLGMRVLAHRRLDGVSGRLVAATGGLVELEVLVVLAALG
jgi:cobalamin synthase